MLPYKLLSIHYLVCMLWYNFQLADSAGDIVIVLTPLSTTLDIHFNDFMFNRFFSDMLNKYYIIEAVFKTTSTGNGTWFNFNVTDITSSQNTFTGTSVYGCHLGSPAYDGLINCTRWLIESSCPEFAATCSPNYAYVISEQSVMYLAGSEIRNCTVSCSNKIRTFYYRAEANVTSTLAPSTSAKTTAISKSYSNTASTTVTNEPTAKNSSPLFTFDTTSSVTVTATKSSSTSSSYIRTSEFNTSTAMPLTTTTTTVSSKTLSSASATTPTVSQTTTSTIVSSKTLSSASTITPTISLTSASATKSTLSTTTTTSTVSSNSLPSALTTTHSSILTTQPPTILVSQTFSTTTSSPNNYTWNITKPSLNNTDDKTTTIIIISVCVAGAAVLALCCIVVVVVCRRHKKNRQKKEEPTVRTPLGFYENKRYRNHNVGESTEYALNVNHDKPGIPVHLMTSGTGLASVKDSPSTMQDDGYIIPVELENNYVTSQDLVLNNHYDLYDSPKIRSTDTNMYSNVGNIDNSQDGPKYLKYGGTSLDQSNDVEISNNDDLNLNTTELLDYTNPYLELI